MALFYALDDYPIYSHFITVLLERRGHRVHSFVSPLDLLAALKLELPDGLAINWYLPWISGPDLVYALRKHSSFATVRIALLSHHTEEPWLTLGQEAGADAVLRKSQRPELLATGLLELLARPIRVSEMPQTPLSSIEHLDALEHSLENRVMQSFAPGWEVSG